jgi:hypothetical protein
MILWLVTAAGALAAGAVVLVYRRVVRRHRDTAPPSPHRNPGICFYLHEKTVMNLYVQGDYQALTQEIEEKTTTSKESGLHAKAHGFGAHASQEAARERVSRYIKDEGPITVIGRIIDNLEDAENIVYVNLFTQSFEPGSGLDRALWSTDGERASRWRTARLGELNPFVFVSVMGRFRMTGKTGDTTTFSAPFDDGTGAEVGVTCANSQFLEEVPTGPFPARCLGRIQKWDPDTRTLVMDPVLTIFQ